MSRAKAKRAAERLARKARVAHQHAEVERLRREEAEALVWQQKLILDGLTEQVANSTCGFAFEVGLRNAEVVVP